MALTIPVLGQQNVIQRENAKSAGAGVTSEWQIPDARYADNQEIEGYASATSVNRGGSINLYVRSVDATYTISIYRVGWYGGAGGRLVAGPIVRTSSDQPTCPITDAATRLVECDWTVSYVLSIPNNTTDATDWASGVYLAKLTGGNGGKQSYIVFVVRDDARPAGVMFQTAVTTYAAYNNWGGYNFYNSDSQGGVPANKVSFNRPYKVSQRHLNGKGAGDFLSWEINTVRFIEREGYDVTYSSNIDTHTAPSRLLQHRAFLSAGHDEYYTKEMYDAVEAARGARVNLAFLGANNIYWQSRLEPSILAGQPNRTVVGYKYDTDPIVSISTTPALATYTWRDLGRPEAALMGAMYDFNSVDLDMVIADCPSWICAGTNVQPGDVLRGMLGYEVDRIAPSSPPGTIAITSSPYDACLNAGCTATERRYANATYYCAASGAGVFATGSMQWNWGLDAFSSGPPGGRHDVHDDRTNASVQQMTRNVLTSFTTAVGDAPPTIIPTPVTNATVGVAYTYAVKASDPNCDALTYSLTQFPAGMSISATSGVIAWTPTAGQIGSHPVTVRVTDSNPSPATLSFIVNVSTNSPPFVTSTPVVAAIEGAAYRYDVEADDENVNALTYALPEGPVGMSIDPATGLIDWTPSAIQTGSRAVTVRVTDVQGLFAEQSFNIMVAVANRVPQIISTPVISATAGTDYVYDVNATDANGDTLTYTLTQQPAGMAINPTTGLIAWTPTAIQAGNHAVTVRVSDPAGLFATQSLTVTVAAAGAVPPVAGTPASPPAGGQTPTIASSGGGGGGGGGCAMTTSGPPDILMVALALFAMLGIHRRRRRAGRFAHSGDYS